MPILALPERCTGCAACFNACGHAAITMDRDGDGFLIPTVDPSKCVECKLCEKSCPVLQPLSEAVILSPKVFAMWSGPDRRLSSSGGAFSAFARQVLSEGGVVFGAAFDQDLHCRHVEIRRVEDLSPLRGSKYVQSEIGDVFKRVKEHLKAARKVLFCGTPCQVAGLKRFLRKPDENLLTLDLICHGVPSDEVFQSYLKKFRAASRLIRKASNFVIEMDGVKSHPSRLAVNSALSTMWMRFIWKHSTLQPYSESAVIIVLIPVCHVWETAH